MTSRRVHTLVAIALSTGSSLGCAHVVGYGRAPDGRAIAVVERCGEQFVQVGEDEHPSFRAVGAESLAVSPAGGIAYAATDGEGWWLVVGGRVIGPTLRSVTAIAWLDADTLAVVADLGGAERVLTLRASDASARTGPAFDAIAAGSLVSTPSTAAYVGWRGHAAHVVVNDALGPAFDGVADLSLAPDGSPSYAARRGDGAWVVRHGAREGPYEDVAQLAADARTGRVVALVRDGGAWFADDGVWRSAPYDRIGDVQLTARRSTLVFRAGRGDDELVVVDGRELGPYPTVVPRSLIVGGPTERVAFVARDGEGAHVVVDGVAGEAWPAVEEVTFGLDGRVGFVARRATGRVVVIDGEERSAWADARDLRLGAPGREVFLAESGARSYVVDGGEPRAFDEVVGGTLAFAPDGETWGLVAEVDDRLVVATSKGTRRPVDLEALAGEASRGGAAIDLEAALRAAVARELAAYARR